MHNNGQEQQCSVCLKTSGGGCRALGNGKACEQLGTPRARMTDYMAELKRTIGYESLKSQYLKQYPSLFLIKLDFQILLRSTWCG